jgi:SAM-dependent methyltransferase
MRKINTLYKHDPAVNLILDTAFAFQKSRILFAAFDLNIFTALGSSDKTAEELAAEIETDPKATERLLNALCTLGFLDKTHNFFSNKKFTRDYLDRNSSYFMENIDHIKQLSKNWETLPEAVREGTSVINKMLHERSEDYIENFIKAMNWRAFSQAADIVSMIDFKGVNKFLDLGCGSAAYSLEVARKYPNIQITVFDLPNVIPITQKYIEHAGMLDRIVTLSGDYLKDDIGKGYDLVFISSIFHSNSIWENMELARKVYDALNPGGRIVIQEFLINEDRLSPEFPVIFSLNMLVNTEHGDTCTETDIWIVLKEAWFDTVKREDTEFSTSLIIGKK